MTIDQSFVRIFACRPVPKDPIEIFYGPFAKPHQRFFIEGVFSGSNHRTFTAAELRKGIPDHDGMLLANAMSLTQLKALPVGSYGVQILPYDYRAMFEKGVNYLQFPRYFQTALTATWGVSTRDTSIVLRIGGYEYSLYDHVVILIGSPGRMTACSGLIGPALTSAIDAARALRDASENPQPFPEAVTEPLKFERWTEKVWIRPELRTAIFRKLFPQNPTTPRFTTS